MQIERATTDETHFKALDDEHRRAANDRATVWGFVWVLFLFKVATVLLTMWAPGMTTEATVLLSITTWPWLIIPALALSGPLFFRYRLRKVRARRSELQRSEWLIEQR